MTFARSGLQPFQMTPAKCDRAGRTMTLEREPVRNEEVAAGAKISRMTLAVDLDSVPETYDDDTPNLGDQFRVSERPEPGTDCHPGPTRLWRPDPSCHA